MAAAEMALGMVAIAETSGASLGEPLAIRVGMHAGDVAAGVIGRHKFIYDVWGDTVNTASRLESHGVPNRVHISAQTYERLRGAFACEARGLVDIKGKGVMPTYLLGARLA
jgi:class 3 adenylate cyclase